MRGIDGWVLRLLEFAPVSLSGNGGCSLVSLSMAPLPSTESNKTLLWKLAGEATRHHKLAIVG